MFIGEDMLLTALHIRTLYGKIFGKVDLLNFKCSNTSTPHGFVS